MNPSTCWRSNPSSDAPDNVELKSSGSKSWVEEEEEGERGRGRGGEGGEGGRGQRRGREWERSENGKRRRGE